MQQRKRPLSPHLQIYSLPLTAMVSVTHRMTGILLAIGLILFVLSLAIIQCGASRFESMQQLIQQPLMSVAIWLMIYALFFHMCHGVRHLFWDAGKSYEKLLMNDYILWELFVSVALTLLSFLFVCLGS